MADTKPDTKTTETKATKTSTAKGNLQPAGESSDPTVQTLLAELQTARLNNNEGDANEVIDKLADLGYAAE